MRRVGGKFSTRLPFWNRDPERTLSRYLAIDIDPQGLFVVAGTARGGAAKVEQALAWTTSPDGGAGPPPLTLETARAIGEQLREQLKAAGIAPAPAVVAVGRDRVILKELKYPTVPPAEEPALVRFQALKELTEAPEDIILDYAPLDSGAGSEDGRRSMAVVVRKDVFGAIQAMCAAAGLRLAGVTPRPYAVAAGLARAIAMGAAEKPESLTDASAVLTLGTHGGEFTVVRNGEVTFTRSVAGPDATNDPLLVAAVRRNIAIDAGANPRHGVQAVYVAESGGGGLARKLRTALSLPVHPYDPLAGAAEAVPTTLRGRFAGAVGLLAGEATGSLPINFASPRQPRAEANPHRTKMLVGALVAVVVFGGGAVFGMMQLSKAEREVKTLTAEKETAEAEANALAPELARAEAIRKWAAMEVVWPDELYDMTDRFPKDDGIRVISFTASPMRSTDPRKPAEAQARLELKLAVRSPAEVMALVNDIEGDNPANRRYYVGTQQHSGAAWNEPLFPEQVTITTKVRHRPPTRYTRHWSIGGPWVGELGFEEP